MGKPFLTYEEQIKKLTRKKGLIISDVDYAEKMLRQNSYFALITGYKHLFKNKTTQKYKDGTKFEDIVALYYFDKGLRELFLKYLCQIERHIRSLVSYYFCEKYGESQNEYLDVNHYRYIGKNIKEINKLVGQLSNKLSPKKGQYTYIHHYTAKYNNVPLWVLLNAITFGSLSKMYMLLTQDIQQKICKNFGNMRDNELSSFLSVLSQYRNVCAHNERLFSHTVNEGIPDTLLHVKLHIPQKGTQYIYGKSDLFAVLIAMRYLLPNEDFLQLKKELVSLIDLFKKSTNAVQENELLSEMGFPNNWKKITIYRKI